MTGSQSILLSLLITLAFGLCTAQELPMQAHQQLRPGSPNGGTGDLESHERHPRYALHKGDVFELNFEFSPEFNQTLTVQPDGFVTLKAVGGILAEGETLDSLVGIVTHAYASILREPVITATLRDFDKPSFIVTGQVLKPGKYELRSQVTALEAVAIAGGFSESAKHSQVVLFRRASNEMAEAKILNMKQQLNQRDLREDIYIVPGDILWVPQSTISKIRKYMPLASIGMYVNPANGW